MNPAKSGFLTSEFWVALAAVIGKVAVLLIAINVIKTDNPDNLVKIVTELVLAIGTVVGLTSGSISYGKNRTEIKRRMMDRMTSEQLYNTKEK